MKTKAKTVTEQFEYHAARAFFAVAFADQCDEAGEFELISRKEIYDVMPDVIDPAAIHAASTLRMDIERVNKKSIEELMLYIEENGNGDRDNTVELFGHYAAMQSMGYGVGLHDAFGSAVYGAIRIPYVDFGSCSLELDYF